MPRIIDSSGEEHEAYVAEERMLVPDPLHGHSRIIFAGQPVPADLEAAYLARKRPAAKKSAKKK